MPVGGFHRCFEPGQQVKHIDASFKHIDASFTAQITAQNLRLDGIDAPEMNEIKPLRRMARPARV